MARFSVFGFVLLIVVTAVGCHDAYTFYETVQASPEGDGYKLVLAKSSGVYWAVATAPIKSSEFYSARGDVQDGKLAIRPKSARRLASARWDWERNFVPLNGTFDWIQMPLYGSVDGEIRKIRTSPGVTDTIASFAYHEGDPNSSAFALAPSGKHLLLVKPDRVQLWDLESDKCTEPADLRSLRDVRKTFVDQRGWVGEWWITDDCRYVVVVVPPKYHYDHGSAEGSPAPEMAIIAGITIDIEHQGIIYDRTTSNISPLPIAIGQWPHSDPSLIGVLSDAGRILLLYAAEANPSKVIVTAMDGQQIASHAGRCRSPGWRTSVSAFESSGRLILFNRGLWIGGADSSICDWNWKSGAMQNISIPERTVCVAIDGECESVKEHPRR